MQGSNTRVDISGGIQASLGGRYALALFELARDGKALDPVGQSVAKLQTALTESAELRALAGNPLISRAAAGQAVAALAKALALDTITSKFLGVLAANRRLSQLGHALKGFQMLAARQRGEASAEVISAHPLAADQVTALKAKLKSRLGRDVAVDLKIDPEIMGGLVVTIGSRRIDSSIRTKLNTLAQAMKG
jgi:F-type H+-transporting ATPase subunit delta